MSAPTPISPQARTGIAARIKVRSITALSRCVGIARQYQENPPEPEGDEPKPPPPDVTQLFGAAMTDIVEEELKAQKGSVDRALQMEASLAQNQEILKRQDRMMVELLLHRETLTLLFNAVVHNKVEVNEKTRAVAKTLGVKLEKSLVVAPR